jgi:hypothetical protein
VALDVSPPTQDAANDGTGAVTEESARENEKRIRKEEKWIAKNSKSTCCGLRKISKFDRLFWFNTPKSILLLFQFCLLANAVYTTGFLQLGQMWAVLGLAGVVSAIIPWVISVVVFIPFILPSFVAVRFTFETSPGAVVQTLKTAKLEARHRLLELELQSGPGEASDGGDAAGPNLAMLVKLKSRARSAANATRSRLEQQEQDARALYGTWKQHKEVKHYRKGHHGGETSRFRSHRVGPADS